MHPTRRRRLEWLPSLPPWGVLARPAVAISKRHRRLPVPSGALAIAAIERVW